MQSGPQFSMAAILAMLGIFLAVSVVIAIVICFIVVNAFKRVPPEHRKMDPNMVWLLLIPIFNLFWNFTVFPKLSQSYQSYFLSVNKPEVGDCNAGLAMAYCICAACTIVPCVNWIAGPAALVIFIIYMVKIYDLKSKMTTP